LRQFIDHADQQPRHGKVWRRSDPDEHSSGIQDPRPSRKRGIANAIEDGVATTASDAILSG
jgi:hypothetical protein